MKKDKRKKILSIITNIVFSIVLVCFVISTIYFINIVSLTPNLNIETINKKKSSKIYDNNNTLIKQLTMEDYKNIKYEDLPDVFINALISCEDVRYFMHEGIDLPRILSALKNDVFSMSLKEGASTLTQQLIKNMLLTNKKSIARKIQEIYLSSDIEKLYSKKDILEFYCNYVCFDGINHGVESASYKFFNKSVKELTLPEAALLAGVVNAPSAYSPLNNKEASNNRKNIVLNLMHKHGYISFNELENAKKIKVEDMLVKKENKIDTNTYPYQAYIDIVYKQIEEKTGYDPYTMPMEIYTYMDSTLQSFVDKLQSSSSLLSFKNDYQQLASTIIDNNNGAIIACFGGKDYKGQKLYNRSYDALIQPASTIKVLLEYALAFEYLNYSNQETLNDVAYLYPNSETYIKNVDNTYMGELSIADAIGYSRNTTAIDTLKKVIDKIGIDEVVSYLKSINLMDKGVFSYSYGLGGYTYGVSVTNLAAAYSMLSRNGLYIEPLAVKSIKLLDGSNIKIDFKADSKKVLSDTTCYLINNVLSQVMKKNIWSIEDCKPKGLNVVAKSGTTSFDKKMLENYNFPSNASKDRWIASYSPNHTVVVWSGFDEYIKGKQTYFIPSSDESNIVKKFTRLIYEKIPSNNKQFDKPDGLVEVDIVKGSNLLATNQVENKYIVKAFYKENNVPTKYFEEYPIEEKVTYDYFINDDEITFIINNENKQTSYNKIFDYDKILGGKNVYIDIYENNLYVETKQIEKIITIPLRNSYYQFDIYYKYKNGFLDGIKDSLNFIYT